MDVEPWDNLIAAHLALSETHARTSNFLADVLDGYTEACGNDAMCLGRVVKFRTEAAMLLGLAEDALGSLDEGLDALGPPEDPQ